MTAALAYWHATNPCWPHWHWSGRLREADGTERTLAISGGFANVSGDGATILAEAAEFDDEIDIERARAARDRAQERLDNRTPDVDVETRTDSTRTVVYTAARVGVE